ncbi:hypothetical protein M413DRAFT_62609 [Hebeloma cylindrosporum]|uniref:G-patch domain-containing protein n=1 Tax=Hebeloma cylindrosporum TaxID=76867 RepID=A0A0C2Z5E0_HEBCY|nr:hypothetical protein M413DRAFT_62609 [Hebeloma cylindrosporum h7]
MDVDENHLHKYDEYIRGPAREVITVETKIKPSNKGFALLAKLGWVEGQPVGLSGDGRTEPIPFHIKSDLTGLGKTSQDVRMIETTVSQRRGLDSERQQKESEEQRKLREESVARKTALDSEISSTLRAFYCELCDKQFKNVAQYDEHTNSYAHHHKARFKDMQASIRLKPKDEVDKRKEKERKREEKELRKIAAANGIKMPKPAAASSSSVALAPPADIDHASTSMEIDTRAAEPKKGGWASITSEQSNTHPSGSHDGTRKSGGWATIGSSSNIPPPKRFGQPPHPPSGPSYPQPVDKIPSHIPTFRNAGWTSLDTGSSQPLPSPPPPPSAAPPPPPSYGHVQSNVPPVPSSAGPSHTPQRGWSSGFTSTNPHTPPPPPPSSRTSTGYANTQNSLADVAPPPPPPPPSDPVLIQPPPPSPPSSKSQTAPASKPARSSWQQFQKGAGRRR